MTIPSMRSCSSDKSFAYPGTDFQLFLSCGLRNNGFVTDLSQLEARGSCFKPSHNKIGTGIANTTQHFSNDGGVA